MLQRSTTRIPHASSTRFASSLSALTSYTRASAIVDDSQHYLEGNKAKTLRDTTSLFGAIPQAELQTQQYRALSTVSTGTSCASMATLDDFRHHQDGIARLNNGSFGACPQTVLQTQQTFQAEWLKQPDALYFDLDQGLEVKLIRAVEALARYLHTPEDQVKKPSELAL